MIHGTRRLAARLLFSIPGWIARGSLPLAFHLADLLATWTLFARRGPADHEVERLFPDLTPAGRRLVIRNAWRRQTRLRLLEDLILSNGITAMQALVRPNQALGSLRGPMTLVTFHAGPSLALIAVAERVRGPVLSIRSRPIRTPRAANVQVRKAADRGIEARAAIIVDAVRTLRAGGFVFVAADPQPGGTLLVPFMNGQLRLSRGAFSPARITRTPVVPILPRWHGDEIEIIIGAPLRGSDEESIAASAARWFEEYLRKHPEELTQRFINLMRQVD